MAKQTNDASSCMIFISVVFPSASFSLLFGLPFWVVFLSTWFSLLWVSALAGIHDWDGFKLSH